MLLLVRQAGPGPAPWLGTIGRGRRPGCPLFRWLALRRCHHHNDAPPSAKPDGRGLRVLFFGTDSFSLATLDRLHGETLKPHACVSRVSACCIPTKSLVSHVRKFAEKEQLPIYYWPLGDDDLRRGQDASGGRRPRFDLGIVASFGKLIPKRVIEAFPCGVLNVHASLLPRWRGAAPIPHAIFHGDQMTGISIMRIQPRHFDLGPILAQVSHPIAADATREQLTADLADVGADLMLDVLRNLDDYTLKERAQPHEGATYAPLIDKDLFRLDFSRQTSSQIYDLFRGLGGLGKFRARWQDTGKTVRLEEVVPPSQIDQRRLDEVVTSALLNREGSGEVVTSVTSDGQSLTGAVNSDQHRQEKSDSSAPSNRLRSSEAVTSVTSDRRVAEVTSIMSEVDRRRTSETDTSDRDSLTSFSTSTSVSPATLNAAESRVRDNATSRTPDTVTSASSDNADTVTSDSVTSVEPGRAVYSRTHNCICVRTKSGWIGFRKLFYGTKRAMSAKDFSNGFLTKDKKGRQSKPQCFVHDDSG